MGLKANTVQVTTGAGLNKAFVSDAAGIGSWGYAASVLYHADVKLTDDITLIVDGNVEEEYEVVFQGTFTNNSGDALCLIRPNNDASSSNYNSHYHYFEGANHGVGEETSRTGLIFIQGYGGGSYKHDGSIRLRFGAISGAYRMAVTDMDYVTNGKWARQTKCTIWQNSADNITSLKFVWSTVTDISGKLTVRALMR